MAQTFVRQDDFETSLKPLDHILNAYKTRARIDKKERD